MAYKLGNILYKHLSKKEKGQEFTVEEVIHELKKEYNINYSNKEIVTELDRMVKNTILIKTVNGFKFVA